MPQPACHGASVDSAGQQSDGHVFTEIEKADAMRAGSGTQPATLAAAGTRTWAALGRSAERAPEDRALWAGVGGMELDATTRRGADAAGSTAAAAADILLERPAQDAVHSLHGGGA